MFYCPHIEACQLIFRANQLTGFYMSATLAFNGLQRGKFGIIMSEWIVKHHIPPQRSTKILLFWYIFSKKKITNLRLEKSLEEDGAFKFF